ncbi:MAG: hypothetical protein RI935_665 [Candidatus Parcubacteria bacterium]
MTAKLTLFACFLSWGHNPLIAAGRTNKPTADRPKAVNLRICYGEDKYFDVSVAYSQDEQTLTLRSTLYPSIDGITLTVAQALEAMQRGLTKLPLCNSHNKEPILVQKRSLRNALQAFGLIEGED